MKERLPPQSAPADDDDEEMQQVVAFAGNQLTIEMSRVNPGPVQLMGCERRTLCWKHPQDTAHPSRSRSTYRRCCEETRIGCWCLTEPGAGSDAFGSMRTTAKKDGDFYILNGSKTFITNGPYGEVFLVYAKDADTRRDSGLHRGERVGRRRHGRAVPQDGHEVIPHRRGVLRRREGARGQPPRPRGQGPRSRAQVAGGRTPRHRDDELCARGEGL